MGKQQVYNRRVWGNGSHQQQQIDIYNPISISINLVTRTRQSNKETLDGWRSSRRRNDNVLGLRCGIGIGSSHGPQTKVLARVQVLDLVDLVLDRALGKERHLVVLHSCRLEHTHVDCELGVWREAQQVRAHSGLVERAHEGTHCSVSVSRGLAGWARFPLIRLVARSRWLRLLLLERPSLFRIMWWWLVLLPARLVQLVCTVAIWALLFIPRVRPNQRTNQSITLTDISCW